MKKKFKTLKNFYFGLLIVLYILVVLTPHIIRGGIWFLAEEVVESIIIAFLMIVSYYVLLYYRKEVDKNLEKLSKLEKEKKGLEEKIEDAFKYIGTINVQIQEIKSIFSNINKYPENNKDYKYIMQFLANKILGIVDADWVVLRIIDTENKKIIREYSEARGQAVVLKTPLGVADMIENKIPKDYFLIKTAQENFSAKAFCLLPKNKLNKEQKIMIQAAVNQLEMLFLIFASNYYRNSRINYKNGQGKI